MRAAASGLVLLLALSGCGVSTTEQPRRIPPAEIPIALPSSVPDPGLASDRRLALYFLVDGKVTAAVRQVDKRQNVRQTLETLLAGPNETESAAGATTRLTGITLDSVEVSPQGVATVSLSGPGVQQLTAEAVAQIVFTLVRDGEAGNVVRSVRFRANGKDLDVPDGSGAVTRAPVDRADYLELLATPAPSPVSPAPSAGSSP